MKVVQHRNAGEFRDRAGPWLAQAEAQNNLILAFCSDLTDHPQRFEADPYLLTVENQAGIVAAALIIPPRSLIITDAPAEAVRMLVPSLIQARAPVPGVLGPSDPAKLFADCWAEETGGTCRLAMRQRIYQCDRVTMPDAGPGYLRAAVDGDLPLLTEWRRRFCEEIGLGQEEDHRAAVRDSVAGRQLYVWNRNRPVSMAGRMGETPNGVRVGLVYTPAELRRRGYATSCVSRLTQLLLDSGKKYCCLYADLANPASNRIYEKVGYRPVCDGEFWRFD